MCAEWVAIAAGVNLLKATKFTRIRPDVYTRRREHRLSQMLRARELQPRGSDLLIRFVRAVCDGDERVSRVSKQQLHDCPTDNAAGHEYLVGMPIHSSHDRITQLEPRCSRSKRSWRRVAPSRLHRCR